MTEAMTRPAEGASRTRRVLLIEDNRDLSEMLRELLLVFGHDVRIAHTGPEGLELLPEFSPDVVICDIGLPGIDGYAVARAIREGATPAPRLIALSGYGQESDRRKSLDAGFDLHLTKPVDPEKLLELL